MARALKNQTKVVLACAFFAFFCCAWRVVVVVDAHHGAHPGRSWSS